ncbi:MAG TPA: hypothetical protein VNH44_03830 [Micropepsaceae bacterium]|nr:hypothetical protein [Micropepsaceae bacterium]
MRGIRLGCFCCGMAAWLLGSTGVASAAAAGADVPAPLMSAAECMARVLRAVPGVSAVEIETMTGKGGAYPVLSYRSADEAGRRRFTELSLFEISGIDDAPYVFDQADIEDDPVAERLLPIWKARCHAGLGYITSVPR